MSTIWIDVRGRPGAETHDDMSVLKKLSKELDALAERLGVTKPSDFFDHAPLLPPEDRAKPTWFAAEPGLVSIATLRAMLTKDFASLRWTPDGSTEQYPQSLLDNLAWCEGILVEAVRDGRRFRLMVVE